MLNKYSYRWHYSPMWTFAFLMDFSQSALCVASLSSSIYQTKYTGETP